MTGKITEIALFSVLFLGSFWILTLSFSPHYFLFSASLALPLIWLCVVDLDRFEIPDLSVSVIAVFGIFYQYQDGWNEVFYGVLAGLITAASMFLISIAAEHLLKKPALGLGDVKLLGAAAIWVGLMGISSVILLASVSGILFVLVTKLLFGRAINDPVPFGPFIALGVWIVWLTGPIV